MQCIAAYVCKGTNPLEAEAALLGVEPGYCSTSFLATAFGPSPCVHTYTMDWVAHRFHARDVLRPRFWNPHLSPKAARSPVTTVVQPRKAIYGAYRCCDAHVRICQDVNTRQMECCCIGDGERASRHYRTKKLGACCCSRRDTRLGEASREASSKETQASRTTSVPHTYIIPMTVLNVLSVRTKVP